MLSYTDILFATTKILSDNFNCDVIIDNNEGAFDNECFYVTLVPVYSNPNTLNTNKIRLIISVKYFNSSKIKNYEVADKLKGLFNRKLQVNDRFLDISNVDPSFSNDEVGNMLDFLISLTYCDYINNNKDEFENMQIIDINCTV